MKVLNLYAGIGGNRKLWIDCDVTAVEDNESIAKVYQKYFPNDEMVIADAHDYLLKHYKEFDFIWSSPPCPTHSDIRRCGVHAGQYEAVYPDMQLYEEIILLKHFARKNTKWVVENVKPYYKYLIEPTAVLDRHPIWTNFFIMQTDFDKSRIHNDIIGSGSVYGFDIKDEIIKGYKGGKRKILRNLVNPQVGLYLLNEAKRR